MYCIIREDELSHHGVKGMKWGVRKDKEQNSYKRNLSDKQKKLIKIGAVVAISALTIYGGYKYAGKLPSGMPINGSTNDPLKNTINQYRDGDTFLKPNTTLQRVSKNSFENLKDRGYIYVSYKFRDNQRYLTGFRNEINISGKRDYIHKLKPDTSLKIASPKTAAKEYIKLFPNDKDMTFRLAMSPYSLTKDPTDKLYNIVSDRREKLYSSLKSKGYSGIVDIEDAVKRKNANPLIIFDPDKYVTVTNSRKIGNVETFVANILR